MSCASPTQDLKTVLCELGESSSLHGIPKIVSSRQMVVKGLWVVLLLATMSVCVIQLHSLFEEYNSYPTKTSVQLRFAPLVFPAVTFCNMNPVKKSLSRTFESLADIITHFDLTDDDNATLMKYLEDGTLDKEDIDIITEEYADERDEFEAWKARFLMEVRKLPYEARLKLGHQREDFVHTATFSGQKISNKLFKVSQSHEYGNCFTLDDNKLVARGSGRKHGLYFELNLETTEYLSVFASAYGVRMVLHEKGTHPLPEHEGITLSNQFETHIGIRMSNIQRLGGKYGDCIEGSEFAVKYNIKYTVPLCYIACGIEHMLSQCHCVPASSPDILNNGSATICNVDDDEKCVKKVNEEIYNEDIKCNCNSRCRENVFTTTLSGRLWPNKKYMKHVLLREICNRNTSNEMFLSVCKTYLKGRFKNSKDLTEYVSRNFLAVHIYFEDLNYEIISEEPLYNAPRFLSDIGGAMGLYMGASILTYVEIMQLIVELILFYRRKAVEPNRPEKDPQPLTEKL